MPPPRNSKFTTEAGKVFATETESIARALSKMTNPFTGMYVAQQQFVDTDHYWNECCEDPSPAALLGFIAEVLGHLETGVSDHLDHLVSIHNGDVVIWLDKRVVAVIRKGPDGNPEVVKVGD